CTASRSNFSASSIRRGAVESPGILPASPRALAARCRWRIALARGTEASEPILGLHKWAGQGRINRQERGAQFDPALVPGAGIPLAGGWPAPTRDQALPERLFLGGSSLTDAKVVAVRRPR